MKKSLLFLICLFIANQGFAQIVNIPDPVFKQRLIEEGIDTNEDGEIQITEAEAVTGPLDVNGQFADISDLTGIEAFVNITELYCQLNMLTTLDLSQNTALVHLECWENPLVSINVTQCVHLDFLEAEHTQLTSIDLSNNINLIYVVISDAHLMDLDLTQNINLESIGFSNIIELTTVDIRNGNNLNITSFGSHQNPNLTCIFIDSKEYMETTFGDNIDPNSHFVETQAECDALEIEENELNLFTIYPNPVRNILNVRIGSEYDFQNTVLVITDILGKTIFQSNLTFSDFQVDFSGFDNGIYFLNIRDERGFLSTQKIVKL